MGTLLITGGCRSGKSGLALQWAEAQAAERLFIATAWSSADDKEMIARIEAHQQARGVGWQTFECPLDMPAALARAEACAGVALVDCLTLWVSNMLLAEYTDAQVLEAARKFAGSVQRARIPVALVTNEVGWGIVPENALARRFRDLAGMVNQILAAQCENVVLAVCGLPITVKGRFRELFP